MLFAFLNFQQSQLRARLVSELTLYSQSVSPPFKTSPLHWISPTFPSQVPKLPSSLLYKVLDTLLLDYFKLRSFEFTLSVFLPESGLGDESGRMEDADVFSILGLLPSSHSTSQTSNSSASCLPATLLESTQDSRGLLVGLLSGIRQLSSQTHSTKESQTQSSPDERLCEFQSPSPTLSSLPNYRERTI